VTRLSIILDERQKKVEITPGFGDGPTFYFMVDQSRRKDEDQLDVLYRKHGVRLCNITQ